MTFVTSQYIEGGTINFVLDVGLPLDRFLKIARSKDYTKMDANQTGCHQENMQTCGKMVAKP